MAAAPEYAKNPWVDAGMADFIAFNSDGIITSAAISHLNALEVGDNIFGCLPVLSGFDDIFTDPEVAAKPISLNGVVIAGQAGEQPLDFTIALSKDATSALVLVTPNFSHEGAGADRLREKRKQAYFEDLLRQERARFEQIYKQSPVSAFALGKDGQVIATSEQLQTWLGDDIDTGAWIKGFNRTHRGFWRSTDTHDSDPVSFRSAVSLAQMRLAIVDVSVFVLDALDGGQETYIAIQDVTAATSLMATLSRQRGELEVAADALKTSNRRLEQFAHVAAHDLLGPLGRMSSFADIIELEMGDNVQGILATAVNAIRLSARESIELVSDLLTLAKLQHFEPVYEDLNIADCVGVLQRGLLADMSIQFEFTGSPTIVADKRLLDLIIRNLISNSYKYRNRDKQLIVKFDITANDSANTSLSIIDNGTGFDDQGVDPFAAFERMREHSDAQGTGLGLAMVKDAADTMGWVSGIASTRGSGTTLLFTDIRSTCE